MFSLPPPDKHSLTEWSQNNRYGRFGFNQAEFHRGFVANCRFSRLGHLWYVTCDGYLTVAAELFRLRNLIEGSSRKFTKGRVYHVKLGPHIFSYRTDCRSIRVRRNRWRVGGNRENLISRLLGAVCREFDCAALAWRFVTARVNTRSRQRVYL